MAESEEDFHEGHDAHADPQKVFQQYLCNRCTHIQHRFEELIFSLFTTVLNVRLQ